jgi:DNA repair exonuclease SbcCD ATPase subunit
MRVPLKTIEEWSNKIRDEEAEEDNDVKNGGGLNKTKLDAFDLLLYRVDQLQERYKDAQACIQTSETNYIRLLEKSTQLKDQLKEANETIKTLKAENEELKYQLDVKRPKMSS